MRIDLFVPYAEKDEAKRLGAKWDAEHKIWYVPDESFDDICLFQKWLKNSHLPKRRQNRNPPPHILFKRREDGLYSAKIDNLEVSLNKVCFEIIVWGFEGCVPCDYSDCPVEKGRTLKHCPIANDCPYEFSQITQENNTFESGMGGSKEIEAKIRDMFKNKHDGLAHHCKWPEPAVSEFATVTWKFEGGD